MAAELGAHIVKTYYCKDFGKVVDTCPVPIVIAGGKKTPEKDALQMAYDAIQAGAIGVDMGRNVFQSEDPVGMMKAVNAIVHKKYTPKDQIDIICSACGKPGQVAYPTFRRRLIWGGGAIGHKECIRKVAKPWR